MSPPETAFEASTVQAKLAGILQQLWRFALAAVSIRVFHLSNVFGSFELSSSRIRANLGSRKLRFNLCHVALEPPAMSLFSAMMAEGCVVAENRPWWSVVYQVWECLQYQYFSANMISWQPQAIVGMTWQNHQQKTKWFGYIAVYRSLSLNSFVCVSRGIFFDYFLYASIFCIPAWSWHRATLQELAQLVIFGHFLRISDGTLGFVPAYPICLLLPKKYSEVLMQCGSVGSQKTRTYAAKGAMKNLHRHVVCIVVPFGFLSANISFRTKSDIGWFMNCMMIQQFEQIDHLPYPQNWQRRSIRNTKVWLEQKVAFAHTHVYIYIYKYYIHAYISILACGFGIYTLINQTLFVWQSSRIFANIDQYSYLFQCMFLCHCLPIIFVILLATWGAKLCWRELL